MWNFETIMAKEMWDMIVHVTTTLQNFGDMNREEMELSMTSGILGKEGYIKEWIEH